MTVEKTLKDIGLSEGEAKVYLALLKLGPSPVSDIKKETKLHRTTIYDFVEKLLNKGLINYSVQNKIRYYKATHPNKLLDFVKEKEELVKDILPNLAKIAEYKKPELDVEVYKGREGFKTLLNDILRTKTDVIIYGADETQFKEKFPILMEQFFKKEEKAGIKERILTSEKPKFIYRKKTTFYKYVPKEFFDPTPTFVFSNRVAILIWEPLHIIMIKNQALANSYKKYFELLWEQAK